MPRQAIRHDMLIQSVRVINRAAAGVPAGPPAQGIGEMLQAGNDIAGRAPGRRRAAENRHLKMLKTDIKHLIDRRISNGSLSIAGPIGVVGGICREPFVCSACESQAEPEEAHIRITAADGITHSFHVFCGFHVRNRLTGSRSVGAAAGVLTIP